MVRTKTTHTNYSIFTIKSTTNYKMQGTNNVSFEEKEEVEDANDEDVGDGVV
ncbi:MAG: hypothetical protein H7329_17980, partial [Opitutaceae bacterium]|nr:hypothetical protein [Cytophagales bacterium]